MKAELNVIDEITREIVLTIDEETHKKDYQKTFKKFSRKVQIDGFRKGKAPATVIERLYTPYIREEYIEEFGNEYYKFALEETKAKPIESGQLNDIAFQENGEIVMKFQFECLPEDFDINYKDLEVPFAAVEYNDTMLDEAIKNILMENAEEVPFDENDTVQLDNNVVLEDIKENIETKAIKVNNESKALEEYNLTAETLLGKKINDIIVQDDKEYKIIDGFKVIIPELTEDIAKALGHDSVEAMKQTIKEELINDLEERNNSNFAFALSYSFGEKNKDNVKLPKSYLLQIGQNSVRQQLSGMQFDSLPDFGEDFYLKIAQNQIPNIIWDLSYEKIAKENNIEVTDEDLENKITELADKFKLGVDEFKQKYSANLQYFKDDILNNKVIEFLKPMSKIVEPKQNKPAESDINETPEYEVISDSSTENE